MFKIEKRDSFKWPVQIHVPRDGGGFATHEFTAEYKMLEQSKIDALLQAFQNNDTDMLPTIVVGWSGVQDSDGEVLSYSEDAKTALLDIPYVRTGLTKAYFEAVSGNKAARKN